MADKEPNERIFGGHTGPDPEKVAKLGDQKAVAQAAIGDLAGQMPGEETASQSSLFEDEACLFAGPVTHVAETFERANGRGRPKGSKNKANQKFREYLLSMGYRHPGLNLADLANADPARLASELGCKRKEAMELVMKANAELMPYFESKRPTEVEVTEKGLHVLVIDNGGPVELPGEEGMMSITGTVEKRDDKSST